MSFEGGVLTNDQLSRFFKAAFAAIGGKRNDSVPWYLNERPKLITRQTFFEQAAWAVWVAGMRAETIRGLFERAQLQGFPSGFGAVARWTAPRLQRFVQSLHGRPAGPRAVAKWQAVHFLAQDLGRYRGEAKFREGYFAGKVCSRDLDDSDIESLVEKELPFIGSANAHFIARNIGGEAVKCDRWMLSFLRSARMTLKQLNVRLDALGIRRGLFDLVVWCYCERFVRNSKLLAPHVRRMAGAP